MKEPLFHEAKAQDEETEADDGFWSKFSHETKATSQVTSSDSEEETQRATPLSHTEPLCSPSPPQSPLQKPSRKATLKLNEIQRRLRGVNSLLSPVDDSCRGRNRRSQRLRNKAVADDIIDLSATEEDDVLLLSSPGPTPLGAPGGPERQIPLKVRCRTDLHKIPVRPSTPLRVVVEHLSVTLGVPPTRLLLLREEAELSGDSTVAALGLGIADILECVVMSEKATPTDADCADVIKVRLQGKDRALDQEFSLRRDAPLGSVFARYSSCLSVTAQRKVRFHFDGGKVSPHQTPEQLDMEDGDIIEVWA